MGVRSHRLLFAWINHREGQRQILLTISRRTYLQAAWHGRYASTDPQPLVTNRASGYEWKKDHFENRPILLPPIAFSAGSLLSTVDDMVKWDAALSSGKLLTKSSLDQIWTPAVTNDGTDPSFNYGFGWFIDSDHGHRLVQHSGGTPGFSSVIYSFRRT